MQVIDVMSTTVYTACERTPVMSAFRTLADHRVSSLPVVDDHGAVVGIVTEQDLLRRSVEPPRAAEARGTAHRALPELVGEVMTWAPVTVSPETDVAEVIRTFSATAWKSLPVVRHGRLVGMVSRSDVVRAFARPDAAVRRDVQLALGGAGLDRVRVDVRGGVVELSGPATEGELDRAAALTRAVVGVRAVHAMAA